MKSSTARLVTYLVVLILVVICMGLINTHLKYKAFAKTNAHQDDRTRVRVTPTPTPIKVAVETNPTLAQPIVADIRRVFGVHSDDALLLLLGNGRCGENHALNPNAVNVNNDGSLDIGVFQVNTYWQGVTNQNFLKDPSINIRMAWNIYKNSGYNFHLWTAGRCLGI